MYLRRLAMPLALGSLLTSCDGPTEPTPIASIEVTAPSTTLASGASVQLSAMALSKSGKTLADRIVVWTSSDQALATVSETGLVTAGVVTGGSSGTVTISASAQSISGRAVLSVLPAEVASLAIVTQADSMEADATLPLSAIAKDASGNVLSGRTIAWATGDTSG